MSSANNYNELDLLTAIADGDVGAFSDFFEQNRDKVYDVAIRLTHDQFLAEEIVADVFMIIWQRRERLTEIDNFQAYLYTVVRNKAYRTLKHIAKKFLTEELIEDVHNYGTNNVENKLLEKEYSSLLRQALDQLSPQQRKVFELIKQQDKKRKEAAEILKIKPETVKYHLAEAMKNIRIFLRPHLEILVGIGMFFLY